MLTAHRVPSLSSTAKITTLFSCCASPDNGQVREGQLRPNCTNKFQAHLLVFASKREIHETRDVAVELHGCEPEPFLSEVVREEFPIRISCQMQSSFSFSFLGTNNCFAKFSSSVLIAHRVSHSAQPYTNPLRLRSAFVSNPLDGLSASCARRDCRPTGQLGVVLIYFISAWLRECSSILIVALTRWNDHDTVSTRLVGTLVDGSVSGLQSRSSDSIFP